MYLLLYTEHRPGHWDSASRDYFCSEGRQWPAIDDSIAVRVAFVFPLVESA